MKMQLASVVCMNVKIFYYHSKLNQLSQHVCEA